MCALCARTYVKGRPQIACPYCCIPLINEDIFNLFLTSERVTEAPVVDESDNKLEPTMGDESAMSLSLIWGLKALIH